jgi:hypothetical protein
MCGIVDPPARAPSDPVVLAASKLVVDTTAARLVRTLKTEGVPSVLLRGPAVARWLYDNELSRPYADVDLLVPDDRFPEAQRLLIGLDFTESPLEARFARGRPAHAETWARDADGATVDLHRTLIGIGAAPAIFWTTISSEAEPMTVGGEEISVPSVPARALLVALHAAQHGPSWDQPLEDLSRALQRVPPDTWRQATVLAERLEATAALASGLRLLPAGESLAATLGLPTGQGVDRALAGSESFHVAQGIEWILETPGLVRKTAFLAHKVAPPPPTMRLRSSLARRGSVGLGVAYVWRFLRLSWYGIAMLPGLIRSRRSVAANRGKQA